MARVCILITLEVEVNGQSVHPYNTVFHQVLSLSGIEFIRLSITIVEGVTVLQDVLDNADKIYTTWLLYIQFP